MGIKTKAAIVVGVILLLASVLAFGQWVKRTAVRGIPDDWSVISGSPDQWRSEGEAIKGRSVDGESLLVSKKQYRDVTMSAKVSTTREATLALRVREPQRGYLAVYVPANNQWQPGTSYIELVRMMPEGYVTLNRYAGRVLSTLGDSAKITFEAEGPWLQVFLNDVSIIRHKDEFYSSGFIGLRVYGWGDRPCDATFANVRFY